jgi:hypothetical protein
VFYEVGQFEFRVGPSGVFEVDDSDSVPVPQIVGKVRVGMPQHRAAARAEA